MPRSIPLTAEQYERIISWYKRRREIGTTSTLAHEMGLHRLTVSTVISRYKTKKLVTQPA